MPYRLREKVNLAIYDSKEHVTRGMRIMSFAVSLIAIGALVIIHGFPLTPGARDMLLWVLKGGFVFYLLRYTLSVLYSFDLKTFLKERWFEGLLMSYLLLEGVTDVFLGTFVAHNFITFLGFTSPPALSLVVVQACIILIIIIEIWRSSNILPNIRIHPSYLFLLSFLIIILIGTALLLLPEATVMRGSMPFIDALFTATSAVTVTGLIVVDTATYFTTKGQIIILGLIQLGALNVIAFGTFFAIFSKFGLGIQRHNVVEDFFGGSEKGFSTRATLGKIVIWSLVIEGVGAILIYPLWADEMWFSYYGEKFFQSLFHSISAFNNAGFSILTDGFIHEAVRFNFSMHLVVIVLMFLGTLGFVPLFDLFNFSKLRGRVKFPWKQIEFSTKIALYFSLGLIIFGAVAFFILEISNTLRGQSIDEAIITSLFQSLTTRNIGLSTVNIKECALPTLLIFLALMFIGAGSASSGGGIRTSTFGLLYASVIATIRSKTEAELFRRTIPIDLIFRAFSVFIFFAVGIAAVSVLMAVTEAHILDMPGRDMMDIVFESVSAFTTTGLSTGITPYLSDMGKILEIVSMYIGRVGTLTVAYLFGRKVISTAYKYAEGYTLVG